MAVPHDEHLARAVDELLDPVWGREVRRARLRRLGDRCGRLAVLLAMVALLSFLTGPAALVPILAFFLLLGSICVFGPDARAAASLRLNRTRVIGA